MKRFISLLLAFAMLFAFCTIGFADDQTKNYVVLGDSIARGSGIFNPNEASYGKMVANTNGYNYTNYGVNGDMTTDLLSVLDNSYVAQSVKDADIISVSIGANNLIQHNAPLLFLRVLAGDTGFVNKALTEFYDSFKLVIAKIKELNPDALILMQTVYNPAFLAKDTFDDIICRLNEYYGKYLEENPGAYEIVDVYSAMKDQSDVIAMDCLHPNGKGNKIIAAAILQKLASLGYGTAVEPVILVEPQEKIGFLYYFLKFRIGQLIDLIPVTE